VPKSGEQDDHSAPRLAAASAAITVSGMFGSTAQTRSPGPTPQARSAPAKLATASWSSAQETRRSAPCSLRNSIAGLASRRRSRFSAKLRRASGNQRVPGIAPASAASAGPGPSPITSQNDQTSGQKCSGCSTDQRCSAA